MDKNWVLDFFFYLYQIFSHLFVADSVEMTGFEPVTFALQRRCSPAELHPQDRWVVGLTGFEPVTPALSAQCSNQLSYKPVACSPQQLRSDRKQILPATTWHRASWICWEQPARKRAFKL